LQHDDDAARTAPPNFAQPIILAYGTCARYSVGALYGRLRKSTINGAKAAEHEVSQGNSA
jgi:hypothetical protein